MYQAYHHVYITWRIEELRRLKLCRKAGLSDDEILAARSIWPHSNCSDMDSNDSNPCADTMCEGAAGHIDLLPAKRHASCWYPLDINVIPHYSHQWTPLFFKIVVQEPAFSPCLELSSAHAVNSFDLETGLYERLDPSCCL
jgi:hypothetical protein